MALAEIVAEALAMTPVKDTDRAAAELALVYASDIDSGGDLTKLGPALLVTLEALHMTPRSRAAVRKATEVNNAKPANPLDELRQRRERRTAG